VSGVLRWIGLSGFLLFGAALSSTLVAPIHWERGARELIRYQLERQVQQRLDAAVDTRIAGAASALATRHAEAIDVVAAREQALERVATVVERMQDPHCPCRAALAAGRLALARTQTAELTAAGPRLEALLRGEYAVIVARLIRDLRIFTGVQAVVFLALLGATLTRPRAAAQLLLPAALLVAASLVAAGFYLFGQDWLRTIVFDRYVGWGYAACVGAVFLLLAEIVINRGRLLLRVGIPPPVPC
jgi:hypothetical protein